MPAASATSARPEICRGGEATAPVVGYSLTYPIGVLLPLLAVFVVSWAFGEMVGYVAGPGDSLARVC